MAKKRITTLYPRDKNALSALARGKRLAKQIPRTPEEALRIENARLERENYLLKMELDLLKKVKELERGDH